MYFIEHGTVDIITVNGKTAAHLRDGDFFGEMALITNERRNATVMAKTYCDLYRLNREDFEDAILGYPEVYNQLVKVMFWKKPPLFDIFVYLCDNSH